MERIENKEFIGYGVAYTCVHNKSKLSAIVYRAVVPALKVGNKRCKDISFQRTDIISTNKSSEMHAPWIC